MLVVNKTYLLSGDMVTNGGIERFHGTMHAMLANWIQANQRTGTRNSQRLLSHIVYPSMSIRPYFLTHGREARIPADIAYGPTPSEPVTEFDFVVDQQVALHSTFDFARQQLGKAASRRKHSYDLRARPALESIMVTTQPPIQNWYTVIMCTVAGCRSCCRQGAESVSD